MDSVVSIGGARKGFPSGQFGKPDFVCLANEGHRIAAQWEAQWWVFHISHLQDDRGSLFRIPNGATAVPEE